MKTGLTKREIKMFIYRINKCIKPKITNRGDFLELSRTQLMELQKATHLRTLSTKKLRKEINTKIWL